MESRALIQCGKLLGNGSPIRTVGVQIVREYAAGGTMRHQDTGSDIKDIGIARTLEEMEDTGKQQGDRQGHQPITEKVKQKASNLKEDVKAGYEHAKEQVTGKVEEAKRGWRKNLGDTRPDEEINRDIQADSILHKMSESLKEAANKATETVKEGARKMGLKKD